MSCSILRPSRHILPNTRRQNINRHRTFLTSSPQILTATRTLPYQRSAIYDLVADIPSYSLFLPYCKHAEVLEWSGKDAGQRRWPAIASLSVGWGKLQEEYVSRVYCIPGRVVEAIAGEAQTSLPKRDLRIYEGVGNGSAHNSAGGDVFQRLRTRWTLEDLPKAQGTKVDLSIEFVFQNPLYAALSSAALPQVAGTVIEAFEKRAKEVLGNASTAGQTGQ